MLQLQYRDTGSELLQSLQGRLQRGIGNLVRAGDTDEAGPTKFTGRFSQQAPWQLEPRSKRFGGIHQHDVQVTVNAAVLKGIVQDDDLGVVLGHGVLGSSDAVGILQVRQSRKHLFQLWLVYLVPDPSFEIPECRFAHFLETLAFDLPDIYSPEKKSL